MNDEANLAALEHDAATPGSPEAPNEFAPIPDWERPLLVAKADIDEIDASEMSVEPQVGPSSYAFRIARLLASGELDNPDDAIARELIDLAIAEEVD